MNDKKFDSDEAMEVAVDVLKRLRPFCERIEIAGSLSRMKSSVHDIEIIYVPRYENRQADMFTTELFDLANQEISLMLSFGVLAKRPSVTGVFSWGKLNKLGIHVASGIPIDLFCEPDILDWPRTLVIRQGPKDFNVRLMASAPRHGLNAHAYGIALTRIPSGGRVIAKTEKEFIELCGIKYCYPQERR